MKATDEQISELKTRFSELYKVVRRGNDYIFRFPTLKEWKEARTKDTTFSTNDKIVSTCLVFPSLKDLRIEEKTDSYLVEVLGLRLQSEVIRDDDGDDGQEVKAEDGTPLFRICRRGVFYTFKYPTRPQWKRISGLISTNVHSALDVLVTDCILDVTSTELFEVSQKDVAFSEQVGSPFLNVIIKDWADSEGKKI